MVGVILIYIGCGIEKLFRNSKKEEIVSILYDLGLFLITIAAGFAVVIFGTIIYYR